MPNSPQKQIATLVTLSQPHGNERGAALIIAISLLAVMSILGVMLLTASTSEIKLTGNYRNSKEAFYAAERGLEYAMQEVTDDDTFSEETPTVSLLPFNGDITVGRSGLDPDAVSTVTYIGSGSPTGIFASDAESFEVRNFIVTVVGISPAGSPNPSRSVIRSHVARLVPKAN